MSKSYPADKNLDFSSDRTLWPRSVFFCFVLFFVCVCDLCISFSYALALMPNISLIFFQGANVKKIFIEYYTVICSVMLYTCSCYRRNYSQLFQTTQDMENSALSEILKCSSCYNKSFLKNTAIEFSETFQRAHDCSSNDLGRLKFHGRFHDQGKNIPIVLQFCYKGSVYPK